MFGCKRYNDDMLALVKKTDLSTEDFFSEMTGIIVRLAKTNFIAGCLTTATGAVAGLIGLEIHKKIKEKKNKELKEADN